MSLVRFITSPRLAGSTAFLRRRNYSAQHRRPPPPPPRPPRKERGQHLSDRGRRAAALPEVQEEGSTFVAGLGGFAAVSVVLVCVALALKSRDETEQADTAVIPANRDHGGGIGGWLSKVTEKKQPSARDYLERKAREGSSSAEQALKASRDATAAASCGNLSAPPKEVKFRLDISRGGLANTLGNILGARTREESEIVALCRQGRYPIGYKERLRQLREEKAELVRLQKALVRPRYRAGWLW